MVLWLQPPLPGAVEPSFPDLCPDLETSAQVEGGCLSSDTPGNLLNLHQLLSISLTVQLSVCPPPVFSLYVDMNTNSPLGVPGRAPFPIMQGFQGGLREVML